MNILKNTSNMLFEKESQFVKRLFTEGWESIGHIERKPDTRTTEQLLKNIDYIAKKCPEVAQFQNELKGMNPEHLGLVSDVFELASHNEMLNTAIDITKPNSGGKSLFQFLMENLPKASKENPASLELAQEIINNTDSIAAKYSLIAFKPLYECKEAAQHIKATVPLVKDIAESTLNGGYLMDYSKEKDFVNAIASLISPDVILEKLQMLPKIIKTAEKSNATCQIELFPFLTNKTPISKINNNLETFTKMSQNLENKRINLTEFLEKNVNMQ